MLALSTVACISEDDLKTEGEINAENLSKLVSEKNLNQVIVYSWEIENLYNTAESDWKWIEWEEPFSIESPYIIVQGQTYYNLARLHKFELEGRILSIYLK